MPASQLCLSAVRQLASKHPSGAASLSDFFLQKVTMDRLRPLGKFSNMCTFVSLIAINIYMVLISRLYYIFI